MKDRGQYLLVGVVLLLVVLLSPVIVYSMPNPSAVYCEEQGGFYEKGRCLFADGGECASWAFFRGECGSEYKKKIPCKREGEKVIAGIGKCCFGLQLEFQDAQNTAMGRVIGSSPSCEKPDNYLIYFIDWLARGIVLMLYKLINKGNIAGAIY